ITASRGSSGGSTSVTVANHPAGHAQPRPQHHARRRNATSHHPPQLKWREPECLPAAKANVIIAPVGDRPFPEDIVSQGSERDPRFTVPGWRPSRAAGILAVVTLLVG